jgi:hypothetical protein
MSINWFTEKINQLQFIINIIWHLIQYLYAELLINKLLEIGNYGMLFRLHLVTEGVIS